MEGVLSFARATGARLGRSMSKGMSKGGRASNLNPIQRREGVEPAESAPTAQSFEWRPVFVATTQDNAFVNDDLIGKYEVKLNQMKCDPSHPKHGLVLDDWVKLQARAES